MFKCECGNEIYDVTEEPSFKHTGGGDGYNYEFGQVEYWFTGEFKCSNCGRIIQYSDSSL